MESSISYFFFLSYLKCLYHLEYQGAVDHFHRYFDYSNQMGGKKENEQKSLIPYSILNKGALFFYFGHMENAYQVYPSIL